MVDGDRTAWLPLLLEADESETIVRSYLNDGDLFTIRSQGEDVGVVLLIRDDDAMEIKNIAIDATHRGQGIGRDAIGRIADRSREAGARSLVVGTANSGIGALRFYQRSGFRIDSIRAGFFDSYPEPIWEDGIRARDMVMFRMSL